MSLEINFFTPSEQSTNRRWWDLRTRSWFRCRRDLKHPPTSVGGISRRKRIACRVSGSLLLCFAQVSGQNFPPSNTNHSPAVTFVNVAAQAGLTAKTIYGDEHRNRYLLETTGSGAAFIDYDNDGWQDIFLASGTRLDGLPPSLSSTNRLYRNNGDGKFSDITETHRSIRWPASCLTRCRR